MHSCVIVHQVARKEGATDINKDVIDAAIEKQVQDIRKKKGFIIDMVQALTPSTR